MVTFNPLTHACIRVTKLYNIYRTDISHRRHAIFWKLSGVNDIGCITDILHFMGFRALATEIDARRVGLLHRLRLSNNSVMNFHYNVFGKAKLQAKKVFSL